MPQPCVGGDAHIAPREVTDSPGISVKSAHFSGPMWASAPTNLTEDSPKNRRGGRLCPPAECSVFSEIFGKSANACPFHCRGGRLCPPTESSAFSEICGESAIFIGPTESSAPAEICEIRAAPHHKIGNEKEQADWLALWLVFDHIARSTLLERRHLVQTYTWRGVPSTIALTRLTLGFHARFARL